MTMDRLNFMCRLTTICILGCTILAWCPLGVASGNAQSTCTATTSRTWSKDFTIEAFSHGPTCANSVVTIIIRDRSGKAIWTQAHIAAYLLSFSDTAIVSSKAMKAALGSWISGLDTLNSSDQLPDWPAGKTAYTDGAEFPFTLAEGIDRDSLLNYRKEKLPLFCFVQGMESLNCVMRDNDGTIIELGLQAFPG
jgi:hypothetical protein